jgi:tRNA-modifying protein YgfZ
MTAPILVQRSRSVLRVTGRDPVRMIQGLATADIEAVTRERGSYTAFLTAKGKMVADARVLSPRLTGDTEAGGLLLDADPHAGQALLAHIARFVPPLFARAEDVSEEWSIFGLYGPGASAMVAPTAVEAAPDETVVPLDGVRAAFAVRTRVTGEDGWDVFVPVAESDTMRDRLLGAGARPASPDTLDALRVAAGQPRWGRELTEDVIPLEAGLLDRAISQTKGCYTGQEVIVRILHRGHVNRKLRRLVFEGPAPTPGTELFEAGNDRPRGLVTSAVGNEAGALGLGYVRREIEPPADLHVGASDGPAVRVETLE